MGISKVIIWVVGGINLTLQLLYHLYGALGRIAILLQNHKENGIFTFIYDCQSKILARGHRIDLCKRMRKKLTEQQQQTT